MAGELEAREIMLSHAEARYRNLVEQIPAVTYMSTLHNSNKPIYVSPQVKAILGFTPEEWMEDPYLWEKQLHPQDCERVKSEVEMARSSGHMYQAEYRFRRRNGWFIWLRDQAVVVKDERGQPLFMQGLMLDISDLKRVEAELQKYATRLERSNQELQDFAYIASHDLQEPLRKIQAFGERLVTRHSHELSQNGREYAERMARDAARMQMMINDLLAYSRVATETHPFASVDLGRLAHEAVIDLQARLEKSGGTVEIEDLPQVEGDPLQLRQVFQNLIGNALKFHQPGLRPVVKVYGKISPPTDASPGKIAQIIVTDNGIGFDEKYLDRIFEPFQRLHGRGVYEGSGIGLSICRKIAERHGGKITAHSQPGEGATFILTLPVKQPQKKGDEGWETDTEVQSSS
jgi:PAS domain S-box-containing protein